MGQWSVWAYWNETFFKAPVQIDMSIYKDLSKIHVYDQSQAKIGIHSMENMEMENLSKQTSKTDKLGAPQFTKQPPIPNVFLSPISPSMCGASVEKLPRVVIFLKTADQESPRPRWCLTLLSKGLWWPTGSYLCTHCEICVKFSPVTNVPQSHSFLSCLHDKTTTIILFPSQRWSQISLKN